MPKLGAHLATAGGWHRALEAAMDLDCQAVQIFLQPPGRWAPLPENPQAVALFREALAASGLHGAVFAHAPYLVNLASADRELGERSVALVAHQLVLAQRLGLAGVVVHPGSAGRESRQEAVARLRRRLAEVFARATVDTPLLLENTAGAGGLLGVTVKELLELAEPSWWQEGRMGLCLDTAHLWAAGYDLRREGFRQAWFELDEAGLSRALKLVHINDTPVPLGSRRDRHAAPGAGELGEGFFTELLGDPVLADVACIMEIPPGPKNQNVRQALHRLRSCLPAP